MSLLIVRIFTYIRMEYVVVFITTDNSIITSNEKFCRKAELES